MTVKITVSLVGDSQVHLKKVMQAEWMNFVLCSCDFLTKVLSKVQLKFCGLLGDNSLV